MPDIKEIADKNNDKSNGCVAKEMRK